jgi:hypothetical protein
VRCRTSGVTQLPEPRSQALRHHSCSAKQHEVQCSTSSGQLCVTLYSSSSPCLASCCQARRTHALHLTHLLHTLPANPAPVIAPLAAHDTPPPPTHTRLRLTSPRSPREGSPKSTPRGGRDGHSSGKDADMATAVRVSGRLSEPAAGVCVLVCSAHQTMGAGWGCPMQRSSRLEACTAHS